MKEPVRKQKIVILGGGYAGVMCANRLAGTVGDQVSITLVNPIEDFVERIRLHEVAAGRGPQTATRHALASLLHPTVRLRIAAATLIRPDASVVDCVTRFGQALSEPYDRLVYAVGSGAPAGTVPGVREYAHQVTGIDAARALGLRLDALPADARVMVVGGGMIAIETVTEIASARPELALTLVTASVLGSTLSPRGRAYLRGARAMRRVRVLEHSPVAEIRPDGVVLAGGHHVPADCVVWAASFAVPDLAARSGLGVDGAGRLVVDEAMRATDHPGVLGVGDGVVLPGPASQHSRMACATAAPQGAHAAETIIRGLRGEQPAAFAPNSLVLSMSLGPGDGLIQAAHGDDTPRDLTLTGRAGAVFNELNNRRYARAILGRERRRAGSYRRSRPRIATYREEGRHAG
jgi:NADH dehydrogenase FAD-containing subunit